MQYYPCPFLSLFPPGQEGTPQTLLQQGRRCPVRKRVQQQKGCVRLQMMRHQMKQPPFRYRQYPRYPAGPYPVRLGGQYRIPERQTYPQLLYLCCSQCLLQYGCPYRPGW